MSAVIKHTEAMPAIAEQALVEVLSGSLYPGAAHNSVVMVLAYCKAAQLDPMLKPVHIVPIYQKGLGMIDVVMPGIGLYRIQAARTGQYAGITEPEFGPAVSEKLGGVDAIYPEWCRVTVKRRMHDGAIAEFTAYERWTENYATAGRDTKAPNTMWLKRSFAQLAKCTEAQALRKAFPEVGAAPTADEMEGKSFEESARDVSPAASVQEQKKPGKAQFEDAAFAEKLPVWQAGVDAGKTSPEDLIAFLQSKYELTDSQIDSINRMAPIEGSEA
jgi:phage recombination protein Bet